MKASNTYDRYFWRIFLLLLVAIVAVDVGIIWSMAFGADPLMPHVLERAVRMPVAPPGGP